MNLKMSVGMKLQEAKRNAILQKDVMISVSKLMDITARLKTESQHVLLFVETAYEFQNMNRVMIKTI